LASFEISSESPEFPFENVFRDDWARWRAMDSGPQTIRINFDAPQTITQIDLEFEEREVSRTQEFTILWKSARDENWIELRRQQFNFSPGTSKEVEKLEVNLLQTTALELRIIPSISSGGVASMTRLQIR
jgi:hypothetical protein